MKRTSIVLLSLLLVMTVLVTPLALSQGSFNLNWSTVDGGGGASSGDRYTLSGTIGQPDAGTMRGGEYELSGGFWVTGAQAAGPAKLHLPLIRRR